VVSVDNHEFWSMDFVYHDSAVKNLQEALLESHSLCASDAHRLVVACHINYSCIILGFDCCPDSVG